MTQNLKRKLKKNSMDFEMFDPEEERFIEMLSNDFTHNSHYEIYVSTNGDAFDSIDVSSIFDTPEKLDEIGFTVYNRRVIALTQVGFEILEQNGFSPSEIIRDYDYGYAEDEENDY